MNRRRFLLGALSAPAVITTPGLLMPVKAWPAAVKTGIVTAEWSIVIFDGAKWRRTETMTETIDGLSPPLDWHTVSIADLPPKHQ
jgi:hypothetical protein